MTGECYRYEGLEEIQTISKTCTDTLAEITRLSITSKKLLKRQFSLTSIDLCIISIIVQPKKILSFYFTQMKSNFSSLLKKKKKWNKWCHRFWLNSRLPSTQV